MLLFFHMNNRKPTFTPPSVECIVEEGDHKYRLQKTWPVAELKTVAYANNFFFILFLIFLVIWASVLLLFSFPVLIYRK